MKYLLLALTLAGCAPECPPIVTPMKARMITVYRVMGQGGDDQQIWYDDNGVPCEATIPGNYHPYPSVGQQLLILTPDK